MTGHRKIAMKQLAERPPFGIETMLRIPQMKPTRKGNNWYFGMKAPIGVDAHSGLVHSVAGTAANVNDLNMAGTLLHGDEEAAFGDAGYQGVRRPVG